MSVNIDFGGKVAMVTGAARGIGAAAVAAFAEAGTTLVITDILPEVEGVAQAVKDGGGQALALVGDISNAEFVQSVVDAAMKEYGRLDFSFNNAGISGINAPLLEQSNEDWSQVIAVNQTSVFYCVRSQIDAMLKGGGGVIVNNSSVQAVRALPGTGPYTASKHAILGLTRQAALEYGGQGIRSVAIGPGFIETDMTRHYVEDTATRDLLVSRTPAGRTGQPEDIGRAVRMLCSDDAVFVNGAYLQVDGGFLQS